MGMGWWGWISVFFSLKNISGYSPLRLAGFQYQCRVQYSSPVSVQGPVQQSSISTGTSTAVQYQCRDQ